MAETLDNYDSVLADLRAERDELDRLISVLEAKAAAKRIRPLTVFRPASLFEGPTLISHQATATQTAHRPVTLYDGSEEILREAGRPLHVTILVRGLRERYGRDTSYKSLAGSLPQDPKQRFDRVAPNTFALSEWKHKHDGT